MDKLNFTIQGGLENKLFSKQSCIIIETEKYSYNILFNPVKNVKIQGELIAFFKDLRTGELLFKIVLDVYLKNENNNNYLIIEPDLFTNIEMKKEVLRVDIKDWDINKFNKYKENVNTSLEPLFSTQSIFFLMESLKIFFTDKYTQLLGEFSLFLKIYNSNIIHLANNGEEYKSIKLFEINYLELVENEEYFFYTISKTSEYNCLFGYPLERLNNTVKNNNNFKVIINKSNKEDIDFKSFLFETFDKINSFTNEKEITNITEKCYLNYL